MLGIPAMLSCLHDKRRGKRRGGSQDWRESSIVLIFQNDVSTGMMVVSLCMIANALRRITRKEELDGRTWRERATSIKCCAVLGS